MIQCLKIMKQFIKKSTFIVLLLTLIGAFLHFYNLNWGAPFYFHPDERNIASAVSQLQFPKQMNPHFFAYGSLPIYTIYFTGVATNYINQFFSPAQNPITTVLFEQAIQISRIFSALFATLFIPILFLLGKKLKNEKTGLLAAFFATASVGFIQFAHFGTFEMWLTFFTTLLFWNCLSLLEEKRVENIILVALFFGILMAIKVSSLVLIIFPIVALLPLKNLKQTKISMQLFLTVSRLIFFGLIALLVYVLSNPYVILAQKDFISSMNYESGVALGTEPVFYTGNFLNTTPGLYQLLHVYPFLLNPLMTIIFIFSFCYVCYISIKKRNPSYQLLTAIYVILFVSQAVLFVKWTRYLMPTLPFIFLMVALLFADFPKHFKPVMKLALIILIIVNSIFALSYFKTAFISPDTRIAAQEFAQHAIDDNAHILTEPADLGVVPFQDAFVHVDGSFNFYELDNHSPDATESQLNQKLLTAQYFIIPSQRILQSRIQNPQKFPIGHRFYVSLLNGSLGFKKIYQTPCDIFCKITYLGDPVYWWEQTASVFDHPTVMIFKKES